MLLIVALITVTTSELELVMVPTVAVTVAVPALAADATLAANVTNPTGAAGKLAVEVRSCVLPSEYVPVAVYARVVPRARHCGAEGEMVRLASVAGLAVSVVVPETL